MKILHLMRRALFNVLFFVFPKWMERLKQEVAEEMICEALFEQIEAREGGLGRPGFIRALPKRAAGEQKHHER